MSAPPQSASAALLIRPANFASNPETRASNRFQSDAPFAAGAAARARSEVDALATALRDGGITVHVVEGQPQRPLPDEVFPNNWLSTHADGTIVLYPMMAPNRRPERRTDIVAHLGPLGYEVRRVVDLSPLEDAGQFLEGTGSLVLDRPERIAYACLSPRTSRAGLEAFAERLGYEVVAFVAADAAGHPIYHTNVMLSVGTHFAVICSAAIRDAPSRAGVLRRLAARREILDLSLAQLAAFTANLLELRGAFGPVIAVSATALAALEPAQRRTLEGYGALLETDVRTIEAYGGGSVRCMLAEVHLPRTDPARAPG